MKGKSGMRRIGAASIFVAAFLCRVKSAEVGFLIRLGGDRCSMRNARQVTT